MKPNDILWEFSELGRTRMTEGTLRKKNKGENL